MAIAINKIQPIGVFCIGGLNPAIFAVHRKTRAGISRPNGILPGGVGVATGLIGIPGESIPVVTRILKWLSHVTGTHVTGTCRHLAGR
jgi:hypothetical protein